MMSRSEGLILLCQLPRGEGDSAGVRSLAAPRAPCRDTSPPKWPPTAVTPRTWHCKLRRAGRGALHARGPGGFVCVCLVQMQGSVRRIQMGEFRPVGKRGRNVCGCARQWELCTCTRLVCVTQHAAQQRSNRAQSGGSPPLSPCTWREGAKEDPGSARWHPGPGPEAPGPAWTPVGSPCPS